MICRDGGCIDTISDTGNSATNDELSQRSRIPLRSHLDYNAEYHDATTHHHRPSPAKKVTKGEDEDGTEQASDLIDGSHEALHCRVALGGCKEIVESWGGDDARHCK